MYTTTQLLDLIKNKHNLPSDYAVAKHLGISHAAVSRHRHMVFGFDARMAKKIAQSLKMDFAFVLLCGIAASAKSTDVKSALIRLSVFAEMNAKQLELGRRASVRK